jgi:uncharacterized membrane protein (UPF0127 family)
VRIRNATRGTQLASEAQRARGFVPRLVGLLGRSSLREEEALVLDPCSSVHTAFMRFPIDVVYVDRAGQVIKVVSHLKPFRMSGVLRGRCSVIELPSGTIASTGTAPGDQLSFES